MRITGLLARVAETVSLYFILLQIIGERHNAVIVSGQEPAPYLLFTTLRSIHRLFLSGAEYGDTLSSPNQFEIKKINYHYRLGYMFWIDSTFFSNPQIMQSKLDGSQRTVLVTGDLGDPADLAVDWLNDKLYWVDGTLRQIEELDLTTGVRRLVVSTGAVDASQPGALALYPFPNYGWLYWSDSTTETIEMVSVTGDDRRTFHTNTPCVRAISIDYISHTIYWIDQCSFLIESLRLDGDSSTHGLPIGSSIFFPSGLTVYQDFLYWSASSGVFKANRSATDAESESVYTTSNTRATGIQVVHPSQQPPAEEYEAIVTTVSSDFTFQCSGECVHGKCIPPGLCACEAGWKGALCNTDIVECSEGNGGCEHTCTDLVGGYQCSCRDGFTLTDDQRTCVESCTSSVVTVFGTPPATATFDPCLLYIRETSTSALASSSMKLTRTSSSSVKELTSTVAYTSSTSRTATSTLVVAPSTSSAVVKISVTEETSHPVHSSQYTSPEVEIEMTTVVIVPTLVQVTMTSTTETMRISSTSEFIEPSPGITDFSSTEKPASSGLSLYILIAIGGGAALLIATIIFVVILTCLIVRYKRRRNRSWSPQKPSKSDVYVYTGTAVDSTSMKPVNGFENGNSSVLSKEAEAALELDTKDFQETA